MKTRSPNVRTDDARAHQCGRGLLVGPCCSAATFGINADLKTRLVPFLSWCSLECPAGVLIRNLRLTQSAALRINIWLLIYISVNIYLIFVTWYFFHLRFSHAPSGLLQSPCTSTLLCTVSVTCSSPPGLLHPDWTLRGGCGSPQPAWKRRPCLCSALKGPNRSHPTWCSTKPSRWGERHTHSSLLSFAAIHLVLMVHVEFMEL